MNSAEVRNLKWTTNHLYWEKFHEPYSISGCYIFSYSVMESFIKPILKEISLDLKIEYDEFVLIFRSQNELFFEKLEEIFRCNQGDKNREVAIKLHDFYFLKNNLKVPVQ